MNLAPRRNHAGPRKRGGGRVAVPALVLLVAIVIAAVIAWAGVTYVHFTRTPLSQGTAGKSIEIPRGEGFNGIVRQLREHKVSNASPLLWRALALRLGVANKLRAGEYALPVGITPTQLLEDMAAGKVLHRSITLVDGWTFAQVQAAMRKAPKLAQVDGGLSGAEVMAKLGEKGKSPEGEFMPDTYDYVLGMSAYDLLAHAHALMQAYLAKQWAGRDKSIPLKTPYQALILASLVERETAVPSELPRIAGVFERRLKIGMKLQTDPSVIYGMGAAYHGKIHESDLKADTPYNTYTNYGLPPTPIALPSRAAIHAVMHPAKGDALYFVAKGDGTHQFSATLAEHNAAVRKYILDKHH